MPDQHDSAQRPRPFVPPAPPFRGPAGAGRPPLTPAAAPNGARPPAPFVARRPAKPDEQAEASPAAGVSAASEAAPARELAAPTALAESQRPVPVSAPRSDAHLYGHDPFRTPTPVHVQPRVESLPVSAPGVDAAPKEAATALAGLPYFDDSGSAHQPSAERAPAPTSGKMHRVEFDPAAVLESIAGRIRSGVIMLPDLDPLASDEATLAAILSALLRDSRR